jgi:lysozyme family protein
MANFREAFDISKKNEGGWVNDSKDAGKETYRGISRVYFPSWIGWPYIDTLKKSGVIHTNYTSDKLDDYASTFYKSQFWDKLKGDSIKNQDVANLIYDHSLSGADRSISMVKAVLNKKFGTNLGETGTMNDGTIEALNKVDQGKFFDEYKKARLDFFKYSAAQLSKKDSIYYDIFYKYNSSPKASNARFVEGWEDRVNRYAYSGIEQATQAVKRHPVGTLLLILGIAGIAYTAFNYKKLVA